MWRGSHPSDYDLVMFKQSKSAAILHVLCALKLFPWATSARRQKANRRKTTQGCYKNILLNFQRSTAEEESSLQVEQQAAVAHSHQP